MPERLRRLPGDSRVYRLDAGQDLAGEAAAATGRWRHIALERQQRVWPMAQDGPGARDGPLTRDEPGGTG